MSWLDPYRARPSLIHSLDARVKLVVALAGILLINATPIRAWPAHGICLLGIGACILLARLPLRAVLGRATLALSFVLLAALGALFVREGDPVVSLIVWRQVLAVTNVGLLRLANVVIKAWLASLVALTLVMTTHFLALVAALRSLGVPRLLAAIILLMYRYLFVLVDEAQRLTRAREARTAASADGRTGGTLGWRVRVTGALIGTLFLRTYERSERIYQAMLCRGFTGEIRALSTPRLSRRDWAYGGVGLLVLAMVAAWARLCG